MAVDGAREGGRADTGRRAGARVDVIVVVFDAEVSGRRVLAVDVDVGGRDGCSLEVGREARGGWKDAPGVGVRDVLCAITPIRGAVRDEARRDVPLRGTGTGLSNAADRTFL